MHKTIDPGKAVYDRDITDKVKEIASELIHKSEKQHC